MLYINHLLPNLNRFPKDFWFVNISMLTNSVAQIVTMFISLHFSKVGLSVSVIGNLIALFGVGGLFGGYLGGLLAEKTSPKTMMIVSNIINSIMIANILVLNDSPLISINIFLMGLANNAFRPASMYALLTFSNYASRSELLAYRRVFVNIGWSLGAAFIGMLYTINEALSFYFMSSIVMVSCLFIYFSKLPMVTYANSQTNSGNEPSIDKSDNIYFVLLLFVLLMMLLIFNQLQFTYAIYLADKAHLSINAVSSLLFISGLLVIALQVPVSSMLSKMNVFQVCNYGIGLLGLGFGMLVMTNSYLLAVISCIAWTVGEIIFFPAILPVILKFGSYRLGTKLGIYQTIFSISAILAPKLGAILYQISSGGLWIICALIALSMMICLTLISLSTLKKTD
ncbi:MFS transporter [Thiotrichales bacterium 19S3-7]|nr:MFS transporter [Thiotrichales bacterium 19S3-7]MCF6800614.1 MFS transporter [Thiotrichales bacterium 19S3-11]